MTDHEDSHLGRALSTVPSEHGTAMLGMVRLAMKEGLDQGLATAIDHTLETMDRDQLIGSLLETCVTAICMVQTLLHPPEVADSFLARYGQEMTGLIVSQEWEQTDE
jgi:hypothetical protein